MQVLRKKRKLERVLERACVKLAKKKGLSSRKMNGLGYMSWPDRVFLPPKTARRNAPVLWVEFKREGEQASPKQTLQHVELSERGQLVHVVDTEQKFAAVLFDYLELIANG